MGPLDIVTSALASDLSRAVLVRGSAPWPLIFRGSAQMFSLGKGLEVRHHLGPPEDSSC